VSPEVLLRRAIAAGWFCVAVSMVFLWLSRPIDHGAPRQDIVVWATYLMVARLAGIGSFAIGCVAIYNRRWNHGMTLLLLSVILPFLAFHWHGTL
jgi:hypothetical protein